MANNEKLSQDDIDKLGMLASMDGNEVDDHGNNIYQSIKSDPAASKQYTELLRKYYKSGLTTEALNPGGPEAQGISLLDREVVLNLANSPQEAVGYLQKKYPEKYFMADKTGNVFVNETKPGGLTESGADWKPLDSTKFTAKDIVDIAPEIVSGAVQTIPWVAGKLNPALAAPAAAANAAYSGLEESARQGLGALVGVNKSIDPGKIAAAAGTGAVLGPLSRMLPAKQAMEQALSGEAAKYLAKKGYYPAQYTAKELADLLQRESAGLFPKALRIPQRLAEGLIEKATNLPKGSAREYFKQAAQGTLKEVPQRPEDIGLTSQYKQSLINQLLNTGEQMMTPIKQNVQEVQQGYAKISKEMKGKVIPTGDIRDTLRNIYAARKNEVSKFENYKDFKPELQELKKVRDALDYENMSYTELENLSKMYQTKIDALAKSADAKDIHKLNAYMTAKSNIADKLNQYGAGRPQLNPQYIEALNRLGITEDALMKNRGGRIITDPSKVLELATAKDKIASDEVLNSIQQGIEATQSSPMNKANMSKAVRGGLQDVRNMIIENPSIRGVNLSSAQAPDKKAATSAALEMAVPAARGFGALMNLVAPELENQGGTREALTQGLSGLRKSEAGAWMRDLINRQFPEATDQDIWNMEQEAKIRALEKAARGE